MDIDELHASADRATQIEQAMAKLVARHADAATAKQLLKMSALDQMDWVRHHLSPPNLTPPPPAPDPVREERARYRAQKRKEYKGWM